MVHTHRATIRRVQAELGMGMPASFPGRTFCALPFFWVGGPEELLGALHSDATVVAASRRTMPMDRPAGRPLRDALGHDR